MEHTPASFEVPELEKILAKKKKDTLATRKEWLSLFNEKDFVQSWHREAHALLRIKRWRSSIWIFWMIIWNSIAATTESEIFLT